MTTITDVTDIILDEDLLFSDDESEIETSMVLCYNPKKNHKPTFKKSKLKEDIDDYFEILEFPEYKEPAYEVIKYLKKNNILEVNEIKLIDVLVKEEHAFAKGHSNDDGYIRLFTILISKEAKRKREYYNIHEIIINGQLIAEKVILTATDKLYEDKMYEDKDDDIENEDSCVICTSSKGELVETPCKHKYHLICLKSVPKFLCPICRTDVTEFLKQQGVDEKEITTRINYLKTEKMQEELHNIIDDVDIDDMSDMEVIRMSIDSLKDNNGYILPYNDIIFDMNANASELFSQISYRQSKKEQGLFVYMYDSPSEFITQMLDSDYPSIVRWANISDFEGTPMYEGIKERLKNLKDKKNQYMVLILFENVADARVIKHNPDKEYIRVHPNDIIKSLLICASCRCHGHSPDAPNREHVWARRALNRLKKIEAQKRKILREKKEKEKEKKSAKGKKKKVSKKKETGKIKGTKTVKVKKTNHKKTDDKEILV